MMIRLGTPIESVSLGRGGVPECSRKSAGQLLVFRSLNEEFGWAQKGMIVDSLTFDMRGGRQLAKPDVARPLDGRVRRHRDLGVCETEIATMRDRPNGERHDSTLVGFLYRQQRTRHQALWRAVPPA